MHKIPHLLAALLAALPGTAALAKDFPDGSPTFYESHTAGLAEAIRTGKPIVMIASADWCAPCQKNLKEVYPSKEVAAYHDRFVWVYLDADKPENRPALAALKVTGIPQVSFFATDGRLLGSAAGATTPQALAKVLQDIVTKHPPPKKNVAPPKKEKPAPQPGGGTDGEALLIPALKN